MAVHVNLQGASSADITVGVSPLAEMMACLHEIVEPEHHLQARPWIRHIRSTMAPDLQSGVRDYAPLWARRRCRLLMPLGLPLGQSLQEELGRLRRLSTPRFVDIAAEAVHGVGDFEVSNLLPETERHHAFVAACERRSFHRGELARSLLEDPEAMRDGLVDLLSRCAADFFDAEWIRVQYRLEGECTQVRERLRTLPLADVLASLSTGAEVRNNPPSVTFDKLQSLTVDLRRRRCLLIPSTHGRPHLIVKDIPGLPVVIHFPVENADQVESITLAQARARLTVLADPSRLALCRHLVNEPITTSELASRMGMSLPQVSRHLARLREAELLVSRREGRLIYHRLDVARFRHLGVDILQAIVR
ncbi:DUF5937 family protein [Streptomyces sioyaensis]|uniref:ArsR/SmtB family transcription factor n=1 Tax=Streptomyces sioyaensis TaxID=67364 RepID=UPI003653D01B